MKKIWNWKIESKIANWMLLALLPVTALCCLECYTHVPWDLTLPIFFLNLVFFALLYLFCTLLFGSTSRGYAAATLIPMIFGLINYFVVDFRSSPIVPWDLYSVGTAASVAGNYEYELSPRLIGVVLGFLVILFLGSRTNVRIKRGRLRAACVLLSALCIFGYVRGIATDSAVKLFGLDTTLFTPNVLYRNNGLAAGFLRNLKYMRVHRPDGYSAAKAQEIAERVGAEQTDKADGQEKTASQLPNVIVIMNEAFSDLSVYGEFETDLDVLPFIHSLQENTVKGKCYVSVKGGNTANTEYEFLTGDTMAFLPTGSVPYQQYIKKEMPSIASYLKGLGYETNAIHPYGGSGWCRDKVYPWLGFDTMTFKPDFDNPLLIRNYISDSSAFAKIIEQYEAKTAPMFTFEVTMQNHGGYSKDVEGFEEYVHLTDLPGKTTSVRAAEKYLTLMLESDRAFEGLVRYFERQDEHTILLMFGDHQPSDYITNTILRLLGIEREGNDEVYFDSYAVPFVMWANYDIEEEELEAVSANYLSGLLFEKAGIPLSGYQTFLEELRREVPALTANMVLMPDGTRRRYDEEDTEELLREYRYLDYNHLSDAAHRIDDFYE